MYKLVKRNKRLMIVHSDTEAVLYTPPDFIRVISRDSIQQLVQSANELGDLSIELIIAFEADAPRAAGYRKRTSNVCASMSSSQCLS